MARPAIHSKLICIIVLSTTESTSIEFFVSVWILLDAIAICISFRWICMLELRIVKAVRFEHHNLVVTFVILILCMIRNSTL